MDLAKALVDHSHQLWHHSQLTPICVTLILLWVALYKFAPASWSKHDLYVDGLQYMGLVVMMLLVALAFAYGGYIGLGVIAFLLVIR